MTVVDGNDLANKWISSFYSALADKRLGILLIGDDPASLQYVMRKKKKCEELGVMVDLVMMSQSVSLNDSVQQIETWNSTGSIDGIMIQLPLPTSIIQSKQALLDTIDPKKDVDCLTSDNLGKVMTNLDPQLLPATPRGILALIEHYHIPVQGKIFTIVGASNLVGKPLAIVLEKMGGTVVLCNEYTRNLSEITQKADCVITATGVPHLITAEHIKKDAIVIDVGTGMLHNKLTGDVDFDAVSHKAQLITPVPGGVGPLTIAGLLYNLAHIELLTK